MNQVSHELLPTAFRTPIEEIAAALSHTGRWDGEVTHGGHVWAPSRWSRQTDQQGIQNDITDRRRAEASLRRNQAIYLAEAQRLSHTGSFGWDLSTGEIFWSEETFRIFECDPAATRPSRGTTCPAALRGATHSGWRWEAPRRLHSPMRPLHSSRAWTSPR